MAALVVAGGIRRQNGLAAGGHGREEGGEEEKRALSLCFTWIKIARVTCIYLVAIEVNIHG